MQSVQNWADSQLDVVASWHNETERTHARAIILRALSYMWCRCRRALCAAFWCSALGTSCRPEVCRCWGRRGEM